MSLDPPVTPALGSRDLRVLDLLSRNASRAEIARDLSCSRSTVERTILDARAKLGAETTIEAVVRAVRTGLI
jgi:DNA-binding CsgD family transcriptional regulator